jgi:hypothetical protein
MAERQPSILGDKEILGFQSFSVINFLSGTFGKISVMNRFCAYMI